MAAGSTYTPIATTTLGSSQATVTFSSIPSTYTDIVLICSARETSASGGIEVKINSDTGSNYSYTQLYGTGSTAASNRTTNETYLGLLGAQVGTNAIGSIIVNFMNYANTTTYKTAISRGNNNDYVTTRVHLWRSTSAINRFDLTSQGTSFASGSTFTLYGIAAA